jgi:TrfA protein
MKKPARGKSSPSSTPPGVAAALTAMERAQVLEAERHAELSRADEARVYQMALFPADKRAMPLDFVPCALFAAVQTKHAPYVRGEKIVSVNGYNITFTGRRLTQVHADVLMGVAALASEQAQGHVARIELRKFMRLIGRTFGTYSRQSLRQLLDDLIACAVRVTDAHGKESFSGHILTRAADRGAADDESVFLVEITRDFCKLFQQDLALVDWEQRLRLKNKPLALWLQLFFSRFHKPITVAELHRLCGSGDELRFFRRRLKRELVVLAEVGAIAQAHVDDDDVLHIAPAGKPLPARFKQPLQAPSFAADAKFRQHSELPLPEVAQVSDLARAEFRKLYPHHDPEQCLYAFLRWPGSLKARLPDRAYLGFARRWVTEQVTVPSAAKR